jgi:glutamine synthetase
MVNAFFVQAGGRAMAVRSFEDVQNFVDEENIRFLKLAFVDAFGVQKNIAVMPEELPRAFRDGISFDASAVAGFDDSVRSDLFLRPDPDTLMIVPWRPIEGKVARMFCDVTYPDGTLVEKDSRYILKKAVLAAAKQGFFVNFGAEVEFYLFKRAEDGSPTRVPQDCASYMDAAPDDQGENIRRDICYSLIDMGIRPEASHHEEGPGQNEVDFRYSDPLTAADNTSTFKWIVKSIAMGAGVCADFSPKPLLGEPGNGMHINMSVESEDGRDVTMNFMAGIMQHIREITLFLNPRRESYDRLGDMKAPRYVSWSEQNRSQLIRIPAVRGTMPRIELRSPDPCANPYLAYALLIYAGLDGINNGLTPPDPINLNLYTAGPEITGTIGKLPVKLSEAAGLARDSEFVREHLPEHIIDIYSRI